ncbi:MAG: hypothetical protein PHP68_05305 [Oscillospiraceae bacterium]|nr:hypothetical protein [Oscillospiraceae bacterium]
MLWAQPISDTITLSLALVLLAFIMKKYQQSSQEETSTPDFRPGIASSQES